MYFLPLTSQERLSGGYTHRAILTSTDLTQSTANTAQAIALFTLKTGQVVLRAATRLVTTFENTADNAHNTTTLIVGDSGDDDRCIASQEMNQNGTSVAYKVNATTIPFVATSDTVVNATIGSMAAKSLTSLNKGEVHILFEIADLTKIA
ncbi:MAG: hypothetical protein EBR82_25440 [Caulobacteraceae bacterium]|nr:hypothetical protein [Caulobacteraceae bacterium]